MQSFEEFASRVFPGDPLGPLKNPSDIPDEVYPLLSEVARCTNIDVAWIERMAGLVIEGLAGLQCLWYLHGLRGEIYEEVQAPKIYISQIKKAYEMLIAAPHRQKDQYLVEDEITNIHWAEGTADITQGWKNKYPKYTTVKLGKLLQKLDALAGKVWETPGFFQGVLKDFETRQLAAWEWEISCHPYDILTMSHNRPWTSCMRPGGEYEYGPLTDLAAGSALMFFFRPDAKKPCGRRILRPGVNVEDNYEPYIFDGGNTYGSGPKNIEPTTLRNLLSDASKFDIPVYREKFCHFGEDTHPEALTRNIYSDTDRDVCRQTDEEYNEAYHNLDQAMWPEIRLDFTTIMAVAESFKGLVDPEATQFDPDEIDTSSISYEIFSEIVNDADNATLVHMLTEPAALDGAISESVAYANNIPGEIPDYIHNDIYESVRSSIQDHLGTLLNDEPTMAYAMKDPLDKKLNTKISDLARHALLDTFQGEYVPSRVWEALDLFTEDYSQFFVNDEPISEVVLIPKSLVEMLPGGFDYEVVAEAEIEGYDWDRSVMRLR